MKLFQVGDNDSGKTTLVKPHSQLMHITHEQKHIRDLFLGCVYAIAYHPSLSLSPCLYNFNICVAKRGTLGMRPGNGIMSISDP